MDENYNEQVLNEVRNIPELSTDVSYELNAEQKREPDDLEKQYDNNELKTYTWEEVRQELIEKLKDELQAHVS